MRSDLFLYFRVHEEVTSEVFVTYIDPHLLKGGLNSISYKYTGCILYMNLPNLHLNFGTDLASFFVEYFNFLETIRILTWELIASAWCHGGRGMQQGRSRCGRGTSQDHQPWTSAGVRVFTWARESPKTCWVWLWMKAAQKQEWGSGQTSPATNLLLSCVPRMFRPAPLPPDLKNLFPQ